ncbi:hypothetical protein [Streptomyces sp. AMCC400023]|uniref:hypothetical protein n=1 Tax=Streptomyces sp. AMCC400023 TaxID=2056258 RepID=UPI001F43ED25|nr:hypothetical protein [Streptomyces sp. AMCC400023]UJV42973.1 hypothetical protein CVT30_26815 [Streptomyces sp. AMCC400023]
MRAPRADLAVTVATSAPRPRWCPTCKAETAVAVDVHALFPSGLTHLTTLVLCEICDDPDDQGAPPCAT